MNYIYLTYFISDLDFIVQTGGRAVGRGLGIVRPVSPFPPLFSPFFLFFPSEVGGGGGGYYSYPIGLSGRPP